MNRTNKGTYTDYYDRKKTEKDIEMIEITEEDVDLIDVQLTDDMD